MAKVLMLNIFGELEVWDNEENFILGNDSDATIEDKKEIEKMLELKNDSPC